MTKKIGVVYCKRIQDDSCIGCAKCYKTVNEKLFAFKDEPDDVRVVFKTHCGDCPGLTVPRVELQLQMLDTFDIEVDEIYFGTCVKKAHGLMNCPMNLDGVKTVIENKFGKPVHVGTHDL